MVARHVVMCKRCTEPSQQRQGTLAMVTVSQSCLYGADLAVMWFVLLLVLCRLTPPADTQCGWSMSCGGGSLWHQPKQVRTTDSSLLQLVVQLAHFVLPQPLRICRQAPYPSTNSTSRPCWQPAVLACEQYCAGLPHYIRLQAHCPDVLGEMLVCVCRRAAGCWPAGQPSRQLHRQQAGGAHPSAVLEDPSHTPPV